MAIDVKYKKKNKNITADITLKIKNPQKFIDHIIEITPMVVMSGDSFAVHWDIVVTASTNNMITDVKKILADAEFKFTKSRIVKFIRLVHYQDKSKLYIYEECPFVGFPTEESNDT